MEKLFFSWQNRINTKTKFCKMLMKEELSLTNYRNKNQNKDFTLIARDCVGGVLYHQLGLKFLSPTINLFLTPEDFNYFCLYLKEYIAGDMAESLNENVDYPVGLLTPIKGCEISRGLKIHFMHYDSFNEAYDKWEERKSRINWDNLFVISSFCYSKETATYTDELVKNWNKIKYKKVLLVDKKYGFDDEFVVARPMECKEYAWLLYQPDKDNEWLRTFNDFDFIKFLNE